MSNEKEKDLEISIDEAIFHSYNFIHRDLSNKENKLIDLHMHSNYSDGELTPKELLNLAKDNDIGIMSLTDHDTVLGNKEIFRILGKDINIVSGIEMTAYVPKGQMHILGYDIDIYNRDLNRVLNELKDNNINYLISLLARLKKDYRISFNHDDIKELVNTKGRVGRPSIAKLCVKYGYAKTIQEAFDKYLVNVYEKVKDENKWLTYEDCITLIKNSGGIPVLAHPNTLQLSNAELLDLLKKLKECGLEGIEAYHSSHSSNDIKKFLEIADDYNFLVSGGSDYHGVNVKPDIEIGTGKDNNLCVRKLSVFEKMKRF